MKPTLAHSVPPLCDPFSSMSTHLCSHTIKVQQHVERAPVHAHTEQDEDDKETVLLRAAIRFCRNGIRTRKA